MVNIVEAEYMLEVTERGTIVLFRRKMRMHDELAWRKHIFLEGGIPRSPKPPMSRVHETFQKRTQKIVPLFNGTLNYTICLVSYFMCHFF